MAEVSSLGVVLQCIRCRRSIQNTPGSPQSHKISLEVVSDRVLFYCAEEESADEKKMKHRKVLQRKLDFMERIGQIKGKQLAGWLVETMAGNTTKHPELQP